MLKKTQITTLLIISLLAACSSTRLIYTFADNFIKDEIEYFFDLDKEGKIYLGQQITEIIVWHRKVMLPNYSKYLNNLADSIESDNFNTNDIKDALADGRTIIEETVIGLTPRASKFLLRYLSNETIELMEIKMIERQKERMEELSIPRNLLFEKRLKRLTSNFERFFGTLSKEQIILLEDHARLTLEDAMIRLQNRTKRQFVFIKFLRTQPTELELTVYLNKLLLRGHELTNPKYKTFSDTSIERFGALLKNMLIISSNSQMNSVIIKLRNYAKDFSVVSNL